MWVQTNIATGGVIIEDKPPHIITETAPIFKRWLGKRWIDVLNDKYVQKTRECEKRFER
jgi:hypothetical protein